ncbi:hypothetical protein Ahy_B03g062053 [Arachis hypogaea]|uniref:Uncharacterized protein n=1 Tax=Arachis hypogaea TaxID=3818 RepID=A0A444ZT77_ARAHY|nr:hypothetical protein Ahy_B03g062053 [Arachis hypogaea]
MTFCRAIASRFFSSESAVNSSSKSYIKVQWVRHIRDAKPLDTLESIQRYVRCQIFCLLGLTLFMDKSTAYVHPKYLPLLHEFQRIHTTVGGIMSCASLQCIVP